jgi:hypothetical protein
MLGTFAKVQVPFAPDFALYLLKELLEKKLQLEGLS